MRILIQFFTALIFVSTFTSCKKNNNSLSDQNTAVIIGVLNPADNVHYIKITRAFVGDGLTSSIDIAKVSDSSYFAKTIVAIEEYAPNGTLVRTFQLHDTTVQNKETTGVFYAPLQKVSVFYTNTTTKLKDDHKYKLIAKIYKSASTADANPDFVIEGETDITRGMNFAANLTAPFNYFAFANNPGEYKTQTFTLSSIGTAKRLVGELFFDYYEYSNGGNDSTFHQIKMPLGEFDLAEGTTLYNFFLPGAQFYETIKRKVPQSNGVTRRKCTEISVHVIGANQILANYIAVNKPSTSIAQNKPDFTNLSVKKGEKIKVIGIFGSRNTISIVKPYASSTYAQIQAIDRNSRRELAIGAFTGSLGFCSWHQSDINSGFSWACN